MVKSHGGWWWLKKCWQICYTFSDCKYYIWILSRKRSLCLFQLILGFLKLIIQRWCARSSWEQPEKNEYSLDLSQPRRYQKTTSWKNCSAFSLKRKGKKTMQDDLADFQEDIPTRKCFCVACTNTWNSHCQLHIEAAFSNITQMCLEPLHQDGEHLYKTQSEQQKAAAGKHRAWVTVDQICCNSNHNIFKLPPATAKFP